MPKTAKVFIWRGGENQPPIKREEARNFSLSLFLSLSAFNPNSHVAHLDRLIFPIGELPFIYICVKLPYFNTFPIRELFLSVFKTNICLSRNF